MIMTFKDIIKRDIKNIFLNVSEFAAPHVINGESITAVVDENSLNDDVVLRLSGDTQRKAPGLYGGITTIYISKEDFRKPKPGAALELDGRSYTVITAADSGGMYVIKVQRTGGR